MFSLSPIHETVIIFSKKVVKCFFSFQNSSHLLNHKSMVSLFSGTVWVLQLFWNPFSINSAHHHLTHIPHTPKTSKCTTLEWRSPIHPILGWIGLGNSGQEKRLHTWNFSSQGLEVKENHSLLFPFPFTTNPVVQAWKKGNKLRPGERQLPCPQSHSFLSPFPS